MNPDALDKLAIAKPCPANWDEMSGDDRTRFCGLCQKNVYNISSLSRVEAAELITKSEGNFCARLSRRKDGTVITNDCPVGEKLAREFFRRVGVAASLLMALLQLPSAQAQKVEASLSKFDDQNEYSRRLGQPNSVTTSASAEGSEELNGMDLLGYWQRRLWPGKKPDYPPWWYHTMGNVEVIRDDERLPKIELGDWRAELLKMQQERAQHFSLSPEQPTGENAPESKSTTPAGANYQKR